MPWWSSPKYRLWLFRKQFDDGTGSLVDARGDFLSQTSTPSGSPDASQQSSPSSSPRGPRKSRHLHTPTSMALSHQKRRMKAKGDKRNVQWIQTYQADVVFTVAILLYALLAGIDVELGARPPDGDFSVASNVLLGIEVALIFVFLIELILRARALGLRYLCRPSGIFDSLLVATSAGGVCAKLTSRQGAMHWLGVVRITRLFRLGQIARVFYTFPELRVVSFGFANTMLSVAYAGGSLLLLIYLGALVTANMLGKNADCASPETDGICLQHLFGSLPLSILTHVKLTLVEAWPDIAQPMLVDSPWWCLYIVLFICISNMAILNTVANVVCGQLQGFVGKMRTRTWKEQQEVAAEFSLRLGELFDQACVGADGRLSEEACLALLRTKEAQALLQDMRIGLPLEPGQVAVLLDREDVGCLSRQEWVAGMKQLTGTSNDCSSRFLQLDMLECNRRILSQAADVEHALKSLMKGSITQAGWRVLHQIKNLERELEQLWLDSSCEEDDITSAHSVPPLVMSPKIFKAAAHATACSSACSTPSSPASELSLPPLEALPAVLKAGMYSCDPWVPTDSDVLDACAELEAIARTFQETVACHSWRHQLSQRQRTRKDAEVQTEPTEKCQTIAATSSETQPGEEIDVVGPQGRLQPPPAMCSDVSIVVPSVSQIACDEAHELVPRQDETCDKSAELEVDEFSVERDEFLLLPAEAEARKPCLEAGVVPDEEVQARSGRPAAEAIEQALSTSSEPGEPSDLAPERTLANNAPTPAEDPGVPGPAAPQPGGDAARAAPPEPAVAPAVGARRGWASEPQAAQRRRELLASLHGRGTMPRAAPVPHAAPMPAPSNVDGSDDPKPDPLGLSRRLRAMSEARGAPARLRHR